MSPTALTLAEFGGNLVREAHKMKPQLLLCLMISSSSFLVVIFHGRHLQNLTAQFIFDRHSDRDSGPVCVIITQNEFFFSAALNGFFDFKAE